MAMSISLKKDTRKTNIKHNNRTMNANEKERNSHIDYSRSHDNKYLVQDDLKELYKREFGKAQDAYNEKQKRADRKIKNYYDQIQGGKKTSLQQEMILQVGDKDDFKNNLENIKIANEVLEEWFNQFQKRNPNLKIYNAVIHNDEASPHLHLNFVPVATGYKRGMDKQVSFDKAIIQQDHTLDKIRPFDDWRNKEVLLLEKMLNERGIERELVGTNEFKDVNEFKAKKDELHEIEKQIKTKEKEIESLTTVLSDEPIDYLRKEKQVEVKDKVFGKAEIIETKTENIVITPEQFLKIKEQVNSALVIKSEYQRLSNSDLAKENIDLKERFEAEIINRLGFENENSRLKDENKDLISVNATLKSHISDLKQEIGLIYKTTKEYIKDRTESVRAFKQVFSSLVDKVREKTTESEFNRVHKRELRKERNNDLER